MANQDILANLKLMLSVVDTHYDKLARILGNDPRPFKASATMRKARDAESMFRMLCLDAMHLVETDAPTEAIASRVAEVEAEYSIFMQNIDAAMLKAQRLAALKALGRTYRRAAYKYKQLTGVSVYADFAPAKPLAMRV